MDTRIRERRRAVRAHRRRRRLRRTVTVAVLVALAVAGLLVERSSLVALAELRVRGVQRLEAETVRSATALSLGTSTLRLDLAAVARRVEALPLVRSAEAERADPLTVVVEVEERTPVGVVEGSGGPVLVDDAGVVLAPGRESGLPRLVVHRGRLPGPGGTVAAHAGLADAHEVFRALPGPLRAAVTRYEVGADPGELVLVLESGTRVRFGRAHRIDEKARALSAVLEELGDTRVATIDVRAPTTPVVRG